MVENSEENMTRRFSENTIVNLCHLLCERTMMYHVGGGGGGGGYVNRMAIVEAQHMSECHQLSE